MAIVEYIQGDITETDIKHIAHGVNCQNKMGSGVAKALFMKWPEVKQWYHNYHTNICVVYPEGNQPKDLLGRVQYVPASDKIIMNCWTQEYYGGDGKFYVDYDAIVYCFKNIVRSGVKEVAIPKIGCGLAGGSWNIVEAIINGVTGDKTKVTVYCL